MSFPCSERYRSVVGEMAQSIATRRGSRWSTRTMSRSPRVTADALIGAFATVYRCERPSDAEVLERIKRYGGDAQRNLVAAGAVPPADALPVGLTVLSALAQLCHSDSAPVLQRVA
jgi:hypothetical protein